jgi:uncharacterized protein
MDMPIKIETRKFKDVDIKGGLMLDCIPTVSIVSGIVGSFLVSSLNLDQVFALESEDFPPVSMVFSSKPKFPARGYASEELKLGVVLTEFQPPPNLSRPLAYKLLSCHDELKCSMIVSFEGLPVKTTRGKNKDSESDPMIFGLASSDKGRKLLEDAKISQMETGMVVGVTAILMNEGRWRNRDVISLIGEISEGTPHIRVAALLIESFNKLFPKFNIDVKPLTDEAEKIESHFEQIQAQAKPVLQTKPTTYMYG